MKRWLRKLHLLPEDVKNLKVLKIITVVSPVLFFCLLELLRRYTVWGDMPTILWVTLTLLVVVIIAAFFFSKFVFSVFDLLQKENLHRLREMAILNEINQTLEEFHNLNVVLNRAMDKLIQITAADSGELYLIDGQNRVLVHALHAGFLDDVFKRETLLQLKKWLTDEGVLLNQQVSIEDLTNLQGSHSDFLIDAGLRSLAIVPLKSSSGTVGIICLFSTNPHHFKPSETNLLLNIGNQIAMAIERARLYEKVQAVAVVEERERIAAELHDGLAQVLGYVIAKSQATRQILQKMMIANDYLVEVENIAQEVYTDTREAILGLRTAMAGDGSMVSALKEYSLRFSQMHSIKTELIVGDRRIPSLPPQTELQAIRVVQEALSNIRKHAKATRATINVIAGEDEITIAVHDDGKGFDVDKVDNSDWTKFGLHNMKERAVTIHGSLSVESRPETGTTITLNIPLSFSNPTIEEGNKNESTDS